jgi:hypothetical protein
MENSKKFCELSLTEQAKSITATINDLEEAIEHHVKNSLHRRETIENSLAQIDRLRERLRATYEEQITLPEPAKSVPAVVEGPRVRVGSPRLAEPHRAADFAMVVAEEA